MTRSSPETETATVEQLQDLQRRADIPNLPTQLTYEARMAVSREGPRAYDWDDKPHRIVYDLCREIERLSAGLAQAPAEPTAEMVNAAAREMWNDRDARHGGSWDSRDAREICVIQTKATARAALIAALSVSSTDRGGK